MFISLFAFEGSINFEFCCWAITQEEKKEKNKLILPLGSLISSFCNPAQKEEKKKKKILEDFQNAGCL